MVLSDSRMPHCDMIGHLYFRLNTQQLEMSDHKPDTVGCG